MPQGYYRFPTVHDDRIVFVAEDDLWEVPTVGGVARRLTTAQGEVTYPAFSPDGETLAFIGEDEGVTEVYSMPSRGGEPRRLTFDGHNARLVGWTQNGEHILYSSPMRQPFSGVRSIFRVPARGGEPEMLPVGPAHFVSCGGGGTMVLCRMQDDSAHWKRYRGGTAGVLWIDPRGDGVFEQLVDLPGNLVRPMWQPGRIAFVSDHEGVANIYSSTLTGEDVRRHTEHDAAYVRHPTTDGTRIVYHAGADIWLLDLGAESTRRVEITLASTRTQRARRFVDANGYLEDATLRPSGHSVLLSARGRTAVMGFWEGAVRQLDTDSSVRHRLARSLVDGERVVVVSDAGGEEALEVHRLDGAADPVRLDGLDIGRATDLAVSPTSDVVALVNHRQEIGVVDLVAGTWRCLASSDWGRIEGFDWSPDGRWLVFGFAQTEHTVALHLADVESGEVHPITRSEFRDVDPVFDDKGRFIYFLSHRDFDPVYDSQSFDLGFPHGVHLCLVTLRADTFSPFVPRPRPLENEDEADTDGDEASDGMHQEGVGSDADEASADHTSDGHGATGASCVDTSGVESEPPTDGEASADEPAQKAEQGAGQGEASAPLDGSGVTAHGGKKEKALHIDVEGIADRVVLFPVAPGRFGRIEGAGKRVFFTSFPLRGSLDADDDDDDDETNGTLKVYDLEDLEVTRVMASVDDFCVGSGGKTLLISSQNQLRVVASAHTEEKDTEDDEPSRKSGWLDLSRVAIEVWPGLEWAQMLRESWRLMRDHFWTADMSGIDWAATYEVYAPLVARVGTRSEFSDLVWEMQGELGTSHAYEYGGDYRQPPAYEPGLLGADVAFDAENGGYRVEHIVAGDHWSPSASSPLATVGVDVRVGDVILAVDGRRTKVDTPLQALLVNKAGREIELTLAPREEAAKPRTVTVKTLHSEFAARYRQWVVDNRARVHEATDGRVGYVHIPNMGARGFSEFFRGYLPEVSRVALIVDVRFNGGGHVSPLLLEKLARRRLGYDVQRWGKPVPYPPESVLGPIVALTNEHAGSDGDIFCHSFKLMGLGPLVGKRTWGGVIGVWPRHPLVDGTTTSQPEFAFWFRDVGWGVENFGTEPDVEVEIAPQDYAAGRDPQLDQAVREALLRMEKNPPHVPEFRAL